MLQTYVYYIYIIQIITVHDKTIATEEVIEETKVDYGTSDIYKYIYLKITIIIKIINYNVTWIFYIGIHFELKFKEFLIFLKITFT